MRTVKRSVGALAAGLAVVGGVCGGVASAASPAIPIPSTNLPPAPTYLGQPATADPIRGVPSIPQNPFMAGNGSSEIHNDGWQSDIYPWGGPLGRSPQTFSSYLAPGRDCGSITFDSAGRVVAICIAASGPELYMFDATTLATLATFSLPPRTAEDVALNPNIFQDFTNGGYFYLDHQDEVVTATTSQHIYVIAETPGTPGFVLKHDFDLSTVLAPDEEINSQLPDSHGLLWFTARRDGVVGTLDFATGAVHIIRLGTGTVNEITKSLAVDTHGGVYIPTNQKLYRFVAVHGEPKISWQIAYPNTGVAKPGQLDAGTGTTPVISGGYVGINDNADPMDVMIYRTAVHPTRVVRVRGHRRRRRLARTVCRVPVFNQGASADENAMIAAGRSYIIENNYGYQTPASVQGGQATAPGFARVDIASDARSCRLVWTNTGVSAPTVVSKLSLANGLIYTYTTDSSLSSPWYWTALNYRTGRTVFQQLAGNGVGYNNNYSGISINSSGTAYLGTLGGIIALRDGP
ncbi:MAG: hypothetical protein ACRDNK_22475 [Solirubrobacteraceae bacterium]